MIVAIIGAESTGKTLLAKALASRLALATGMDCVAVPEWLRLWCEREGRTPRQEEQYAIAQTQREWLVEANRRHAFVIADTTPLMTAVYSDLLFNDRSLYPSAVAFHRDQCGATLLMALDIEWAADGIQRDGPHVREPVDGLLRNALGQGRIGWSSIVGRNTLRVDAAVAAVRAQLSKTSLPRQTSTRLAPPTFLSCADHPH